MKKSIENKLTIVESPSHVVVSELSLNQIEPILSDIGYVKANPLDYIDQKWTTGTMEEQSWYCWENLETRFRFEDSNLILRHIPFPTVIAKKHASLERAIEKGLVSRGLFGRLKARVEGVKPDEYFPDKDIKSTMYFATISQGEKPIFVGRAMDFELAGQLLVNKLMDLGKTIFCTDYINLRYMGPKQERYVR